MYGQYTRDLAEFARGEANRITVPKAKRYFKDEKRRLQKAHNIIESTACQRGLCCCKWVRDKIFKYFGEDWCFLALLGASMALLSFAMDYAIAKFKLAHIFLYKELHDYPALQYVAWVIFPIIFLLFSTGFVHIVSPQAIGSGIPEMKTILRGVVLKEYLTFKTLIAKIVGLTTMLGSGMPVGKEGPFVHIASIVAQLLGRFITSFQAIYENESRNSEMLAAACAVGVACSFAAPIGGVLFSIEVTATYFAVRNYWRGFFAAVCGAAVFRLLAVFFTEEDTITAIFKTKFRLDFPFDPIEILAFGLIGVACGLAGALFVYFHRKIVFFMRNQKRLSTFLRQNRFIYPTLVAFIISSLTFPLGVGQYSGGELTFHQAIDDLFSNFTWSSGQHNVEEEQVINHWKSPVGGNIFLTLSMYIIMKFWMTALATTLPVPAGVFIPVFVIGAAFGRLVGEAMAVWFPNGIRSWDGDVRTVMPGGYAVVGAAALAGSVTHTISTSVIVSETTGQLSHILPVMIAVLISNAVAQKLQPSIYDSIIQIKKLPYLPDISSATSKLAYSVFVEDFMVRNIDFLSYKSTYGKLKNLLSACKYNSFPLVDDDDSMVLLGSVRRAELYRLLERHLGHERRLVELKRRRSSVTSPSANGGLGGNEGGEGQQQRRPPKPSRFTVTRVFEDPNNKPEQERESITIGPAVEMHQSDPTDTLKLPPGKSILKKSPVVSPADTPPASPYGTLHNSNPSTGGDKEANPFQEIFQQPTVPAPETAQLLTVPGANPDSNISIQSISKKRVRLPEERVCDMSYEEQQQWEEEQLNLPIDFENCQIDPAPFQLVERTSLHKVHSMFSLLGLDHAYVTTIGRMVGIVTLKEVRYAIEQVNAGDMPQAGKPLHQAFRATLSTSFDGLQPELTPTFRLHRVNSLA